MDMLMHWIPVPFFSVVPSLDFLNCYVLEGGEIQLFQLFDILLVGGFNPIWKNMSQIGSSFLSSSGENQKNIWWNHHLVDWAWWINIAGGVMRNSWSLFFAKWDPSSICKTSRIPQLHPLVPRHHIHHFVRLQRWWRRSFRMDLSGRYGWLNQHLSGCSISRSRGIFVSVWDM